MTKQLVFNAISQLPDRFELGELIDCLLLIEQIEKGRTQSLNGQTIPIEEVKRQVAS